MATSRSEITPEEAAAIFAAVAFQLSGISAAPWLIQIQRALQPVLSSVSELRSKLQSLSKELSQLGSKLSWLESQQRKIWSLVLNLQKQLALGRAQVAPRVTSEKLGLSWSLPSRLGELHPLDAARISLDPWASSGRYLLMRKLVRR